MVPTHAAKILIVDDEPSNIVLLSRYLDEGYAVTGVYDGTNALKLLATESFDLVLLDIMMPRVTGFDVLEAIRANEATLDTPVILISALTENEYIVGGLELGANDYITKPIEPEIVMARVRAQIALKQLQDERKRVIRDLQRVDEMKDRFLRIASHDLKNPLANITLVNHIIRERHKDDPQTLELLELGALAADSMRAVIRDFLDSAALESGQLELTIQPVPVADIFWAINEQFRLRATKKHIDFRVEMAQGIVYADRARIMQVVENLVSNAIKYSPEGGIVTLVAESEEGWVRIAVTDEGAGIPLDEQPRLFTQFGKLSTQPTDGEGSTGLGLWIVKHLVTLQGGEVGVESVPGQGSVFWVQLPAMPESEAAGVLESVKQPG